LAEAPHQRAAGQRPPRGRRRTGLVAYTPLGADLLDRLETECVHALRSAGYDALQLPHIMADADLAGGEEALIQNFAPSPPCPAQSPRTSRSPARETPIAA